MRYIVWLKDGVDEGKLVGQFVLREFTSYKNLKMFSFEFDTSVDNFTLSDLSDTGFIKSITEDMHVSLDIAPSESEIRVDSHEETEDESTFFGNFSEGPEYAGHLELISSRSYDTTENVHIFKPSRTGANVDIYIIDTGVNFDHPNLAGRVKRCPTFTLNLSEAEDRDDAVNGGHGTSSALCAAGAEEGVARQATIYALKVFDAQGSASFSSIVNAVDSVIEHHNQKKSSDDFRPSVINLSLGANPRGSSPYVYIDEGGVVDYPFLEACKTAIVNGIHVCKSAGNGFKEGGESNVFYGPLLTSKSGCMMGMNPELIPNADPGQGIPFVVGATNSRSSLSSRKLPVNHMTNFSNYGIGTNISAPGGKVAIRNWQNGTPGTIYENDNGYTNWVNGTSFSCPMTAGVVALFAESGESPEVIHERLIQTATRNTIPNLISSNSDKLLLHLDNQQYSFSYDKDTNTATFDLMLSTDSDSLDDFLRVLDSSTFIPGKSEVGFRKVSIGDKLQLEFSDP